MKITTKQLKSLVVSVLNEATCPKCGDKNAYQGMNNFECSTPGCSNYSAKQAGAVKTPTTSVAPSACPRHIITLRDKLFDKWSDEYDESNKFSDNDDHVRNVDPTLADMIEQMYWDKLDATRSVIDYIEKKFGLPSVD